MVHKAPYTQRWITYMDAYRGDYFKNISLPEYKSNMVSNYIFSTVETIRPIMIDNNPKFQSLARQPEGMKFSNDCQEALTYEWDREDMNAKIFRELINVLVLGTSVIFIPWDSDKKQIRGIPVNPFNIFTDPLATCVEDAEYIIYAKYMNEVMLKRMYPEHADKLTGGSVNYSELVYDNDADAQLDNQILVLEIYTKDYEKEEYIFNNEKVTKSKYPNGRQITMCPVLSMVLDDKPIIYNDGEFPFETIKDFDVPGKFWGEGEAVQLLSPQIHINALNNAIIDTAKTTANMPWIIDKNAGIPFGKITGRPGLIIRKNPGSDVRREPAPQMPMYVVNAVDMYKDDIQQISGVYDTLKGDSATGVYTAQGILALQEAGQVRIRLKIKLLENSLGKIGRKWYSRMKQFWKEDKWLTITKADGSYDMKKFTKSILNYDYDISISAGSTMPVNRPAMLDLMIRLAQTPMPDGQQLVDREAVAQYLPSEIKATMLERMNGKENQSIAELQQGMQQIGEQMQQMMQQLQAFQQQDAKDDKETLGTLEEVTSAIEGLNKKILQLQQEHDKLVEEEKQQKIKDDSYNEGYKDAESVNTNQPVTPPMTDGSTEVQPEGQVDDFGKIPDEMLEGIQQMSDEELQLLLAKNPDLETLLK